MQILVVVASIQMRTLKTEVEKGFMRTLIGHELAGPKAQSNFVLKGWRAFGHKRPSSVERELV